MGYYFETHVVDHCNLNCAGCAHFSSLVKHSRCKDLNEFKIELQRLVDLFGDDLGEFNLLGGEPLLHPQIENFLIETRSILGDKTIIDLTTNGLLMKAKGEEFYNLLNSLKIRVKFSDYGLDIDKSFVDKIEDILVLEQQNSMFNISLNLNATQNKEGMHYCCDNVAKDWWGNIISGCWNLKNGQLFICPISAYISDFEREFNFKFDETMENAGINIFTHNKEEIVNHLLTYKDCCKYCNIFRRLKFRDVHKKTEEKISEWVDDDEPIPNRILQII